MFQKGHVQSDEVKAKIRASKIGVLNPNYGKKLSDETKQKMSKSRMGKKHPKNPTMISKQRESLKRFYETPEGILLRQRLSEVNKGTCWHKGFRHEFSDEVKAKMGKIHKRVWQDKEFRERTVKAILEGSHIKPNKPELAILSMLNEVAPKEWKYVGDGQLIIAGKNPDFVNVNGKKQLIECYGVHWHRNHNPQDRIDLFSKFGYSTLIIWESELKNQDKVIVKIKAFCEGVKSCK